MVVSSDESLARIVHCVGVAVGRYSTVYINGIKVRAKGRVRVKLRVRVIGLRLHGLAECSQLLRRFHFLSAMIELKEFAKVPTFRIGSLGASSREAMRSQSSASDKVPTVPLLGSTRDEVLETLRQREAVMSELYAEVEIQEAMNRLISEGRATKEEHPDIWTAPVAQAFGRLVRRMREEMVNRRRFPTIQENSRSSEKGKLESILDVRVRVRFIVNIFCCT